MALNYGSIHATVFDNFFKLPLDQWIGVCPPLYNKVDQLATSSNFLDTLKAAFKNTLGSLFTLPLDMDPDPDTDTDTVTIDQSNYLTLLHSLINNCLPYYLYASGFSSLDDFNQSLDVVNIEELNYQPDVLGNSSFREYGRKTRITNQKDIVEHNFTRGNAFDTFRRNAVKVWSGFISNY